RPSALRHRIVVAGWRDEAGAAGLAAVGVGEAVVGAGGLHGAQAPVDGGARVAEAPVAGGAAQGAKGHLGAQLAAHPRRLAGALGRLAVLGVENVFFLGIDHDALPAARMVRMTMVSMSLTL